MPAPRKYPKEVRRGAVRLVTDARRDPATAPGAIARIARQLDINKGALRNWVRQAEIDTGDRPGQTSDDKARIAQLERENFELRRANEILTRRIGGSASAEGTDPWHGVPAQAAAPAAGAAAAGLRPAALAAGQRPPAEPLAPVLVQATQYEPYPDDPRPEAPTPRRELRWSRFGQSRSSGSVA